jgi:hypothetical protein
VRSLDIADPNATAVAELHGHTLLGPFARQHPALRRDIYSSIGEFLKSSLASDMRAIKAAGADDAKRKRAADSVADKILRHARERLDRENLPSILSRLLVSSLDNRLRAAVQSAVALSAPVIAAMHECELIRIAATAAVRAYDGAVGALLSSAFVRKAISVSQRVADKMVANPGSLAMTKTSVW